MVKVEMLNITSKVAIGICTKNRNKSCVRLLKQLSNFNNFFSRLILIEDVDRLSFFSKRKINFLLKNSGHIEVIYKKVEYNNISRSRQEILDNVLDEKILIFIDDDISLSKKSIYKTVRFLEDNPQISIVSGLVKPFYVNSVSIADFLSYYQELLLGRSKIVEVTPFSFVGINYKYVEEKKVKFDKNFILGEDIDFSIQLNTKGTYRNYFYKDLINYHFFKTDVFSYFKKKYSQGRYIDLLNKKHPSVIDLTPYSYDLNEPRLVVYKVFGLFKQILENAKMFRIYFDISVLSLIIYFLGEVVTYVSVVKSIYFTNKSFTNTN